MTQSHSDKQDDHQSRLASIGQIAAGIAHEVRNPLTAVKGFLQLLQKQNPHAYIEIAQQELENAIATLQNLLSVAKPDLEDEPITSFSLCTELQSILSLFQDQVYKVAVETKFEHRDTEISGRKNQLKRTFFNMIKNAFEAIPSKGKISIHHYREGDTVHVKISDTGVGIPSEKLKLLGTPFFTTKSEGTGMGLVYVFSTVYQHGGKIDVESKVGEGTTFHFQFPLYLNAGKEVAVLDLLYEEGVSLHDFIRNNRQEFERQLFIEAIGVKDAIQDVHQTGEIDLIGNVHKLVELTLEHKDMEISQFAQEVGHLWARHPNLNLSVKLEWFHAVRRVLWGFLYNYELLSGNKSNSEQFFAMERQINNSLDTFIRNFFMSCIAYKEEQLKSHKAIIDDLSVPIIPITASVSICPLLGAVDGNRVKAMQQKVLQQIGESETQTLYIDISSAVLSDHDTVRKLFKMMDGITYMGCSVVVTGLRPEVAVMLIELDLALNERIQIKSTLRQAMEELGICEH